MTLIPSVFLGFCHSSGSGIFPLSTFLQAFEFQRRFLLLPQPLLYSCLSNPLTPLLCLFFLSLPLFRRLPPFLSLSTPIPCLCLFHHFTVTLGGLVKEEK